jgi:hypothetical protein
MFKKYGEGKIAEKKFTSLLIGCLQYKGQSSRIRIFGRFLRLYNSLSNVDLRLYFELVE